MSYTTVELVRTHLATESLPVGRLIDQSLVMNGTDDIRFADGPVDAATFVVKSNQSAQPIRTAVSLTGGGGQIITGPIVPGSVLVASDSSLGVIYTENRDYIVDYADGALLRKSGSRFDSAASLVVWFMPFTLYVAQTDYILDASNALIRRIAGGTIADGESVFLDYDLISQPVTGDVLSSAVNQANDLVASHLDPDREFGADPVLIAAATYRALEIVSYSLAARELSSRRGDQQVARTWLTLAEQFSRRASELLDAFRPPADRLSSPVHT